MSAIQIQIIPSFPFSESLRGLQDHDESIQVPCELRRGGTLPNTQSCVATFNRSSPSLSPFVAFWA